MLIGNLGKDPEVRYVSDNVAVASFSLATTESYKDSSGNRVNKTEWHNITVWRGLAEVAKNYLKKGSKIYLEGKITTRQWEDQQGQKRYTTDIIGNDFRMLDKRDDQSGGGGQGNYSQDQGATPSGKVAEPKPSKDLEDDLPF